MPIIKNLYIDYKNLECTGWISSEIFKDELNLRFNPVTNIDIESKLEKLKKSINMKEETLYKIFFKPIKIDYQIIIIYIY